MIPLKALIFGTFSCIKDSVYIEHSHKLPWKILGWGAVILFGGIGGAALLRVAA